MFKHIVQFQFFGKYFQRQQQHEMMDGLNIARERVQILDSIEWIRFWNHTKSGVFWNICYSKLLFFFGKNVNSIPSSKSRICTGRRFAAASSEHSPPSSSLCRSSCQLACRSCSPWTSRSCSGRTCALDAYSGCCSGTPPRSCWCCWCFVRFWIFSFFL